MSKSMSKHNIVRGLTISVEKVGSKNMIEGLYFKGQKVLENWELIASISLVCTNFLQKGHAKNVTYTVGDIQFQHTERRKVHFLKITILTVELYLDVIEVKLIPAILNRVIARCDVLGRNTWFDEEYDESMGLNMFNPLPIVVERYEEEVNNDDLSEVCK